MKVTYIERIMRDRFSCVDRVRTITLYKAWNEGGLVYGYKYRYNIVTLDRAMILEIDGKPGEYRKKHGSYTEMELVKG